MKILQSMLCLVTALAITVQAEPVVLDSSAVAAWDLTAYDGQSVRFDVELTVCDTYNWERRGEITLSADGRLYAQSNWKSGETFPTIASARTLTLDDGNSAEYPRPLPFSEWQHALRVGDCLRGLSGVLSVDGDQVKIVASGNPPELHASNRPDAPEDREEIRVAAFNVLNYFLTLDERGANSEYELLRQQAKLISALSELNADILALSELENDNGKALGRLLAALNTYEAGQGRTADWCAVARPDGGLGSDAIQVGLAYRSSRVTLAGNATCDRNEIHSRPPLGVTFRELPGGERFSVVVSHFKSKGCRGAEGENSDHGQGCWNAKRVQQARSLLKYAEQLAAASGDPDILLVGDFNACAGEDPALVIESGSFVQLLDEVPAESRYTYVYRGEACALDHAYASSSMDAQVTHAGIWHVNADEPRAWDYNMEHREAERFVPDPWRSSDHDPVWIDLRLGSVLPE